MCIRDSIVCIHKKQAAVRESFSVGSERLKLTFEVHYPGVSVCSHQGHAEQLPCQDVGSGVRTPDICLLYTSDAADDLTRVDLGGRRIIKKKKKNKIK